MAIDDHDPSTPAGAVAVELVAAAAAAREDASKVAGEVPGEDLTDAAAWASAARVLMNLDEFITRE